LEAGFPEKICLANLLVPVPPAEFGLALTPIAVL
jgi:hypothetical protein